MSIEVGQKIEGKVTGITNFGAFVSLPENQSGLVHISEVADGFVKDIKDFLTVGDMVEVKVLKMTPDGKINLSIRQAKENAPVKRPERGERFGRQDNYDRGDRPKFEGKVDAKFDTRKPPFKNSKIENKSSSNYKADDFDTMMNQFLKDSEDRLTSLRRNTEGKRGGRGGRRG